MLPRESDTRTLSLPILIGAAYLILAVLYGLIVPMYEAPDENYHFAFAQRLAQSWELPVQNPAAATPWFQEGSQPPLYYYLASLIVRIVDPAGVPAAPMRNPHAAIGIGLAQINNNVFVRGEIPLNTALAFYLTRLMSIALGGWTLWAVYNAARLVVPNSPAVAQIAMAFTAFSPMFLFISASVNNDNLVTALAATGLWLLLLLWRQGFAPTRVALLALTLALASLSKLSGLTLYVVAGVLLVIMLHKRRITLRQALMTSAAMIAAFAVIAGWWYARNLHLYGDLTGTRMMISVIGARETPYTLDVMLNEMQGLRISFWALFGWFNVIGPDWFFGLMDALTVIALIGGMLWIVRETRARRYDESLLPLGLLALHFLITFAALINWTRQTPGTQGRLLFPALAAIATLTALGWWQVGRLVQFRIEAHPSLRRFSFNAAVLPLSITFAAAAFSPFFTIAPAYAPPPIVEALPADATRLAVRFGQIEMLGFRIDSTPIYPGSALPVTLYYRGEPDARNLSLYLTALQDGQPIGKVDSYPGGGNLPTSAFAPGRIYADTYRIPIDPAADAPRQFAIECGWWDFATKTRLTPVNTDNTPLEALILRGGSLIARDEPLPMQQVTTQVAVFSGALRLNGHRIVEQPGEQPDSFEVELYWEALTRVYEDFNVFAHLVAEDGTVVRQADGPPRDGRYPTSAWAVGRAFRETRYFPRSGLKPGTYRVVLGFYRLHDGSRLPVSSSTSPGSGGGDSLTLHTPIRVN